MAVVAHSEFTVAMQSNLSVCVRVCVSEHLNHAFEETPNSQAQSNHPHITTILNLDICQSRNPCILWNLEPLNKFIKVRGNNMQDDTLNKIQQREQGQSMHGCSLNALPSQG